jgi:FkbM family methyltransferase
LAATLNRWSGGRFAVVYPEHQDVLENIQALAPQMEALSWLYEELANDISKQTLIKVLAYRLQGHVRVRLPLSNQRYWRERRAMNALGTGETVVAPDSPWPLRRLDLTPLGFPVELFMVPMGAFATFSLRQYEYGRCARPIRAAAGDHVIDAGACWGDTALYFAHCVGPTGRVRSFEFLPANLAIFERNLALNPRLASRIEVVPKALWDRSGAAVQYAARGTGTAVLSAGSGDGHAETMTVDDLVGESRVDFIKMDIEGAELKALRGAARTIVRHRPTLAIAVYHSPTDLAEIPRFIASLGAGYDLFLDHFTIHREETILFASRRAPIASASVA